MTTTSVDALADKIEGGLAGAVIGDALGAITETLSIRQIEELYGWLDDFVELRHMPYDQDRVIGAWTDDASLVVAMSRAAVDSEGIELDSVVTRFAEWARDPALAKFSGPSTKRAIARIAQGEDPRLVGMGDVISFTGASNGGAMKAAPAGWIHPGDPDAAADAAAVICTPTHNTQIAISGAAAVAAACAQALVTDDVGELVEAALHGARLGETIGLEQGREVAGPSVVRRIETAVGLARRASSLQDAIRDIADLVGAGLNTYESVPAAIALVVAAGGDADLAAVAAANIGDDTDTVGSMAAAIAGTRCGIDAVNPAWYRRVSDINQIDLRALALELANVAAK